MKLLSSSTAVLMAPSVGIQEVMAVEEDLRMIAAKDRIGAEQTAEEENFRQQEGPHAKLGGGGLLLRRIEMVSQPRRVLVVAHRRCAVRDSRS